jgi:hypothetical protein
MGKGWYAYPLAILNICNTAIWYNLRPVGNLESIWYIFPSFGKWRRERSGNPARRFTNLERGIQIKAEKRRCMVGTSESNQLSASTRRG